jgi:heat shock protein HslJ
MKKLISLTLFIVLVLGLVACASSASTPSLTGTTWQWTAMQTTAPASQSMVPPSDAGKYTIKFNPDGNAEIKADCNGVGATYTTSGSSLSISLGAGTLMYCGDTSLDQIYLTSLAKVNSYAIDSSGLHLNLADNGGKMDFQAAK